MPMNPTQAIDAYISHLPEWQKSAATNVRALLHDVDSEIVEEWKWEIPVFTHRGMVCAIGTFTDHLKINFFQGAALGDPEHLFNAGLEAKKTRAIDLYAEKTVDYQALKALLLEAVRYNEKKK